MTPFPPRQPPSGNHNHRKHNRQSSTQKRKPGSLQSVTRRQPGRTGSQRKPMTTQTAFPRHGLRNAGLPAGRRPEHHLQPLPNRTSSAPPSPAGNATPARTTPGSSVPRSSAATPLASLAPPPRALPYTSGSRPKTNNRPQPHLPQPSGTARTARPKRAALRHPQPNTRSDRNGKPLSAGNGRSQP